MLFRSKKRQLRVVLKPTAHVLDAYGQKVPILGCTAEFSGGRYETNDPEIITLMLRNAHKNNLYIVVDDEDEWLSRHPQYNFKGVDMTTGASATVESTKLNVPAAVAGTQQALRDKIDQVHANSAPVVDLDKMIEDKVKAQFIPLMEKLDRLLDSKPAPAETPAPVKTKRVFTCPVPGCGQEFRSGIEVGEHKRTAHATPSA